MSFSEGNDKMEKLFRWNEIESVEHLYQYLKLLASHRIIIFTRDSKLSGQLSIPSDVPNYGSFRKLAKYLCDNKHLLNENDDGVVYNVDSRSIYIIEYVYISGKFNLILGIFEFDYMEERVDVLKNLEKSNKLLREAREIAIKNGDKLKQKEMRYKNSKL